MSDSKSPITSIDEAVAVLEKEITGLRSTYRHYAGERDRNEQLASNYLLRVCYLEELRDRMLPPVETNIVSLDQAA